MVEHQAGDITGGAKRIGQQAVCTHLTQLHREGPQSLGHVGTVFPVCTQALRGTPTHY